MDGKQLRRKFAEFNAHYFNNKLPPYSIRVVPRANRSGGEGETIRERRLIKIRRGLRDEMAVSTLLHEMAHAATGNGHGMKWKREMIRLRRARAPLVAADRDVSIADWDGVVTKRQWREACKDGIYAFPTLDGLIKDFIWNIGGATTVSAFLRQYPWAGAVFREAKKKMQKDIRAYQKLRAKLKAKRELLKTNSAS